MSGRCDEAGEGARLRVAVDASAAFNQGAGIGRYARALLPAAAGRMPGSIFTLFYAADVRGDARFAAETLARFDRPGEVRVRRAPLSRRRIDQVWFRARLPAPVQLLTGGVDVVYSPDFTVPPAGRTPRLVTIHDLAFDVFPEHCPGPLRHYLSAVVPRQIRGADRVVAVSAATKHDIVERMGVDPDRIVLIPNGVDSVFFQAVPLTSEQRATLGVPESYVLMVGTIEPRKNHINLFAAMRELGEAGSPPLVVAGGRGWEFEPILAAAAALQDAGRVILLDYVPEDLLPRLYAGAEAVVYPSWYEGFGLPVVEALAAGVPVVASTAPALREVGGDEAIYADPARPEEIAAAIAAALTAEQRSEAHRARRRARAKAFDWGRSGAILAQTLAAVVDERRGVGGGDDRWR